MKCLDSYRYNSIQNAFNCCRKTKEVLEKLKAKAAYKVKKLERQDKRYINKEMVLKADTERQLRCRLQKAVKYGVSELPNQPIVMTSTPQCS